MTDKPEVLPVEEARKAAFDAAQLDDNCGAEYCFDAGWDAAHRISSQARPDGELVEVLTELTRLMDDVVEGTYKPDSFTTQPAHRVLAALSERIAEGRYAVIVEAVGEQEAERLIVADMGSVDVVYEHLVSIGTILS